MARAKTAKVGGAPVKVAKNATVARVIQTRDGVRTVIREYTKEEHKDDFVQNATEFASKSADRKVETE